MQLKWFLQDEECQVFWGPLTLSIAYVILAKVIVLHLRALVSLFIKQSLSMITVSWRPSRGQMRQC